MANPSFDTSISPYILRDKPLLTVADMQFLLGTSRTSTYEFLKDNPPFRILHINHSIRIPSKDVFDWIEGNQKVEDI